MTRHAALLDALGHAAGAANVHTDPAALARGAADLYAAGPEPVALVRPETPDMVARTVGAATSLGYAVAARGGGLSYTGGYRCGDADTVLIDLGGLDRIEDVSAEDMFVTAQAGVTWKQLYETLAPLGLRLPFFGTFSGAGATVGGGLSHGALFFGSARYGGASDMTLGLEVATADGRLLRTGQWGLQQPAQPVFRNFGPDLTGLFLHDGGALGIKTRASLRLIRAPAEMGYASFLFTGFEAAGAALSEIARAGLAEDAYVLDAAAVSAAAERQSGIKGAITTAIAVARAAGGGIAAMRAVAGLALGGRAAMAEGCSLHCAVPGSSKAGVAADLATVRRIALASGGRPVEPAVPRIARANPFPNLDGVLGPGGRRWAALNAKVPHSDGPRLIAAHRALMAQHTAAMAERNVTITYLLSALGNHSFSFEAVFHWNDAWLPSHVAHVDKALLASYREPAADAEAFALVDHLRQETVELFRQFGAASNQIGRTYPFIDVLDAAPAALLRALKSQLDPQGRLNPGVLGLG